MPMGVEAEVRNQTRGALWVGNLGTRGGLRSSCCVVAGLGSLVVEGDGGGDFLLVEGRGAEVVVGEVGVAMVVVLDGD